MNLLNIDARNEVRIALRSLIGESIAVLGIKGSGKTNTAAVLIEELLENGLPMTIVDIEGEYWGLKQKYEIFVIGRSENVDIEVAVTHAAYFAEYSLRQGVSLILDLSELDQSEMQEFLLGYFTRLWQVAFTIRRPYQIILEEAHEFIPQSIRSPLKEVLTRIALRGRKRGLGMVIVSQRSAKVEKDVLTQAAVLFLHRVVHPIDMKVYQDIVPLPSREVENKIGELRLGEALIMLDNKVYITHIRVRHTYHVGITPELKAEKRPQLKRVNSTLLADLRKLLKQENAMAVHAEDGSIAKIRKLESEVLKKDQIIAEQEHKIEGLQSQVDLLSKLKLTLEDREIYSVGSKHPINEMVIDNLTANTLVTNINKNSYKGDSLDAKQLKRFEHLLSDLKKVPRFQRAILIFLVEREGTSFTIKELARWLNLSASTLINRPPLDLIKMGLIVRSGFRGNYHYQSSVYEQMGKMFPSFEPIILTERLIQHLK